MRGFKPFSQKTYGIAIFPLKYIRGFTLLTKISTHLQSNEHPTFSPSFASTFSTPPLFRHFQSLSPPSSVAVTTHYSTSYSFFAYTFRPQPSFLSFASFSQRFLLSPSQPLRRRRHHPLSPKYH